MKTAFSIMVLWSLLAAASAIGLVALTNAGAGPPSGYNEILRTPCLAVATILLVSTSGQLFHLFCKATGSRAGSIWKGGLWLGAMVWNGLVVVLAAVLGWVMVTFDFPPSAFMFQAIASLGHECAWSRPQSWIEGRLW
jgi:hypothetical protein